MYGSYQEIDSSVAGKLLSLVPPTDQPSVAARLRQRIGFAGFEMKTDLDDLRTASDLDDTTREALIQARIGQGRFRSELEALWSARCSVTGCNIRQVLRASHIKRWRDSSNRERLDPRNGLLLVATLDALFECGLISFDDGGNMLLNENLRGLWSTEKQELGLGKPMRIAPETKTRKYLSHHRKYHGFDTDIT
jgi:predicted restriction endonuclease